MRTKRGIVICIVLSIFSLSEISARGADKKDLAEALEGVIRNRSLKELKVFLKKNKGAIRQLETDKTPSLIIAARYGTSDLVKYLIQKGAKVNAKKSSNDTALHAAGSSINSNKGIYKVLLANGAKIEARNENGRTPIFGSDLVEDIQYLISRGAKINVQDNQGMTPLHNAADLLKAKTFAFYIKKKLDPKAVTKDGRNLLHIVCASPFPKSAIPFVKLLLKKGVPVNAKEENQMTPLEYVLDSIDKPEAIQLASLLIKNKADAKPALLYLCKRVSNHDKELAIKAIPLLVKIGADPKAKDKDGLTPLHYIYDSTKKAKERKLTIAIAQALLDMGADINAVTQENQTPLDIHGDRDTMAYLAKYLKQKGAKRFEELPKK